MPEFTGFTELNPLREAASSAATGAAEAEANALTLPDMLRDALTKKFADPSNPLFQQQQGQLSNILTLPERTRFELTPDAQGGMVFSPTQIRSLIAGEQAAALTPLSTTNQLIELGYGGIGNVINSASNLFRAQSVVAREKANQARQSFVDALSELTQKRQLELEEERIQLQREAAARSGASKTFTTEQVGDKIYSYDPSTGKLVEELGLAPTGKEKYGEEDIATYANEYAADRIDIKDIPLEIRAAVTDLSNQLQSQKGARFFPDVFGFAPFGRNK